MNLKALFEDDGAVSPVIGVILMVAITVILAAVIGTFVLGLGDRVSEANPNAQFTFDYKTTNDGTVQITHDGGDGIETSQLTVQMGGQEAWDGSSGNPQGDFNQGGSGWSSDKITAGASISLYSSTNTDVEDGKSVKVIWTASGSDKTAVIGESEVSL